MENLKFTIFSIVIIALLGLGGYWAFSTIESGSSHVDRQELKKLKAQNEELTGQVTQLKNEVSLLEAENEQKAVTETVPEVVPTTTAPTTTTPSTPTSTSKYQSLINDLQKLVDGNTSLKKGSKGVAVGYVQKFLNIYNGTSNKIDNDFGVNMETAVKKFQKDQGLTSDGEVGPGTLKKMISWLKSKS